MSVVLPCYRAEATIARAVESIAAQTARPLEVLIVDDASGETTRAALAALCGRFGQSWIRVIELTENRGPASARNAGWQAARGDYVAFLDADDAWHPHKLEIQCAFMAEHPEFEVSGHRHAFGAIKSLASDRSAWCEVGFGELLWSNRFVTPSAMVRRSLEIRFRDGQRHMEDHLLWMQIAAVGNRIALIEAPLASLYKEQFGESGVSGDLFATEIAELGNYRLLLRERAIGLARFWVLCVWSLAKFLRRLAIVARRRAGWVPAAQCGPRK